MFRINNNQQASEINISIFKHSTNTISPTDTKYSNQVESEVLLRLNAVLAKV